MDVERDREQVYLANALLSHHAGVLRTPPEPPFRARRTVCRRPPSCRAGVPRHIDRDGVELTEFVNNGEAVFPNPNPAPGSPLFDRLFDDYWFVALSHPIVNQCEVGQTATDD